MGSVVHFGESGKGPDTEETCWRYQAENLRSNQTCEEEPAMRPDLLSQFVRENPHGDFVTIVC